MTDGISFNYNHGHPYENPFSKFLIHEYAMETIGRCYKEIGKKNRDYKENKLKR